MRPLAAARRAGTTFVVPACLFWACLFWAAPFAGRAAAGETLVAVATNFSEVMSALAPRFETATGQTVRVSAGSTGKLYAQIRNGAPFDVLLAADQHRPALLAASRFGVDGSVFTYAVGRLTLWSADAGRVGPDGEQTLAAGNYRHLAIANPKLAPYGLAAEQTLRALGLWQSLQDRIVQGENIGQTFSLVATGNAALGLVALSYVVSPRNTRPGSRWDVPSHLHAPIRQDAVLLARGADNPATLAFVEFLRGPEARQVIARFGYGVD